MSNASDFVIEDGILKEYVGSGGEVVIPEGVTGIAYGVFGNSWQPNLDITSVEFPSTLTALPNFVCQNCRNLTRVVIPSSIKEIPEDAFAGCSGLMDSDGFVILRDRLVLYGGAESHVVIPDGVTHICSNAFSSNMKLESVYIPDSVAHIGARAFDGCRNLTAVRLPIVTPEVDDNVFRNCIGLMGEKGFGIVAGILYKYTGSGTVVVLPEETRAVEGQVFESMGMEEVVFPNHTVTVGDGAFYGCSNLKRVTITPESLAASNQKGLMFGASGKTIELLLLRQDAEPLRAVGAFRKAYWSQQWNYKADYLIPLTDEDLPNYDRLVATGDFEGFKMNEQGRLQAMVWRLLEKDRPVVEEYRVMFGEFLAGKFSKVIKLAEESEKPEYVRAAIAAGAVTDANKKKIINALKKSSMEEIRQLADQLDAIMTEAHSEVPEEAECTVEKKYLDQLKKINAKAVLLKSGVESLPEVSVVNGTEPAPVQYLQLILAEYISQYKKKEYVFAPLADEAANLLDRETLERAVVTLYKNATPESVQLTFLPAIFRYADGNTVNEVYRKYAGMKWMEQTIKNCLLLSDTREAMILAEKNKLLDKYAAVRGTDSDYIRYTSLYDFGFEADGKKYYDLGSTKLEVTVNQSLTLSLRDSLTGKVVKSIPKKGADPVLYAAASSDFSEMKKNLRKAVSSFVGRLFQMYLNGTGTKAEQWALVYLANPVLRQTASLLVWSQGGKTFTLNAYAAIDCREQPYTLGVEDILIAHPSEMSAEEIAAWQEYFITNNLKQPFEQIWEPVVDFETVTEDRYSGVEIPAYRFKGQEKHGITFEFDFGGSYLDIGLNDCWLEYDGGTAVGRHDLNLHGNLVLGKFRAEKSRAANHIIGLLDKWTIYNRILTDDVFVIHLLHNATLAQIADYVRVATENHCTNVTAALLDYKNRTFGNTDPMDEFILDL